MLKNIKFNYLIKTMCIMIIGLLPSCALGQDMILEAKDIQFFKVIEDSTSTSSSHSLKISGLAFHSSLAVDGINVSNQDDSLLVYVHLVPAKPGISGSFQYTIPIPNQVNLVQFGKEKVVIWKRGVRKE